MSTPKERCRRLLADVFKVRLVDVTEDDVATFLAHLRRHGFVLVPGEAVVR